MRLLDCFIELISYVAYFRKIAATSQPDFHRVKADIEQLVGRAQQHQYRSFCSAKDFDLAQFAVFAWIDETILNSTWQARNSWQGEQLQRIHYQTVDAGELFFDRLNVLDAAQVEVREVYYLCLALGFSGRFCNPGDNILLDQLKTSNLRLMTGAMDDLATLENRTIFSGAYQDGGAAAQPELARPSRFPWEVIAGLCGPVLLFGGLFLIFRFVLDNVGQHFIAMVP
ncbi:MAG: hypothetical protein BWK76_01190 [Desulfobulbaceae bacterium A2]|nr:MAG: hypothetical protein BWK76_01190 [Desulfobulbaceae bacterium A2]